MPICQCCKQSVNNIEKHHIISKSLGGSNDKFNIAKICRNCHGDVHSGHIVLEGQFMTTNGMTLIWHYEEEDSITGRQPDCYTWRKT